jgi:hypothetical protein
MALTHSSRSYKSDRNGCKTKTSLPFHLASREKRIFTAYVGRFICTLGHRNLRNRGIMH